MDRLDELEILLAIVDSGSLVSASRRLRRSPPAVTRALAALEDRIGVRLVERTTRRVAPTEAGLAFAERARALLMDYTQALTGAARTPVQGVLRVTAPVQFGRRHVAPIVSDFLNRYREVRIELVLSDRNLDLIDDAIDVAVRIGPLADSSMVARHVGAVTRVTVASPAYTALRGVPQVPGDLAAHDTIFGMPRSSGREWRFGPSARGAVVRLSPRLSVDDVETQIQAAHAGRGITRVLSYQVRDELASGRLLRLLENFEPEPLPVNLVTTSRMHAAPKIRAFLDLAADSLRTLDVLR